MTPKTVSTPLFAQAGDGDGRGIVHDLVQRQEAEVDGHDLHDRPHAAERRADASADEGAL